MEEPDCGLCWWSFDFNKEIEESTEQTEIHERIARQDHGSDLERTASGLAVQLARSLSEMCWDMNFLEEWMCSLTVMAPKVVGGTSMAKFGPIAGLCAMRKSTGLHLAQFTPFCGTEVFI